MFFTASPVLWSHCTSTGGGGGGGTSTVSLESSRLKWKESLVSDPGNEPFRAVEISIDFSSILKQTSTELGNDDVLDSSFFRSKLVKAVIVYPVEKALLVWYKTYRADDDGGGGGIGKRDLSERLGPLNDVTEGVKAGVYKHRGSKTPFAEIDVTTFLRYFDDSRSLGTSFVIWILTKAPTAPTPPTPPADIVLGSDTYPEGERANRQSYLELTFAA